jgi:hypothetical protein
VSPKPGKNLHPFQFLSLHLLLLLAIGYKQKHLHQCLQEKTSKIAITIIPEVTFAIFHLMTSSR